MRNLKLLTFALLGATTMFLSSCAKDENNELGPTLTVTEASQTINNGALTVTKGDSVQFMWDARKGSSDLDVFSIKIDGSSIAEETNNGNMLPYSIKNADDEAYEDGYSFMANAIGTKTYTFMVTDKNGLTKSVDVDVTVNGQTTPLASAQAFQWKRVGSNAGTGLAQFGLQWTSNSSTSAIVKKDAATKFVQLNATAWTSLATHEDLSAAIDNGTVITQYTGVSAQSSGTYNDVLAVRYNGADYLLHITAGTVTTGGSSGTTITIDGMYKM